MADPFIPQVLGNLRAAFVTPARFLATRLLHHLSA